MGAGRLGSLDDGLGRGSGLKAGDVLRHRAVEQLHVLRKIADVAAEIVGFPLLDGGAVEADIAAQGRPDADDGAGERRLAGGAGPDQAEALAGAKLERRRLDDRLLAAGRTHIDVVEGDPLLRPRKRHALLLRGHHRQDMLEAMIALARRREPFPVRHRDLDGRQRARHHDRGRDHRAARHLALDHQVGGEAENAGLQHHAEHLGEGAIPEVDSLDTSAASTCLV